MREKHKLEYDELIKPIAEHDKVMEMLNFVQHGEKTTYDHCVRVSRHSYAICKRLHLDYKSAAVAGMLHDFFIYNWREEKIKGKDHIFLHPIIACMNAQQYFHLNEKEQDIIKKHMFPLCKGVPRSVECIIVSTVDKYIALAEFMDGFAQRMRRSIKRKKKSFAKI